MSTDYGGWDDSESGPWGRRSDKELEWRRYVRQYFADEWIKYVEKEQRARERYPERYELLPHSRRDDPMLLRKPPGRR